MGDKRGIAVHVRRASSSTAVNSMESTKDDPPTEKLHHTFTRLQELRERQSIIVDANVEVEPTTEESTKEHDASNRLMALVSEEQNIWPRQG